MDSTCLGIRGVRIMGLITPQIVKDKLGESIIIRTANTDDAQKILDYNVEIISTEPYLVTTPSEFNLTVEQEKNWIEKINQNINSLLIVSEYNGTIVGLLDFHCGNKKRFAHTGSFGMSVRKDYRNRGIGRSLVNVLIQWVKENETIEKICLEVFSNAAINLYNSVGFTQEGRLINQIKLEDGSYVDLIQMGLILK
jgi:RimJ/RimL family protein N-acetyltransferase